MVSSRALRSLRGLATGSASPGGVAEVVRFVVRDHLGRRRSAAYTRQTAAWAGKRGLEIGGPSAIFRTGGALPIYPIASCVDNLDFAPTTLWTAGEAAWESDGSQPGGAARRTMVGDATQLEGIGTGTYDFLLSSHVLEHLANPGRALRAWRRVLRPGGSLVLVVPDRRWTFDHRRPATRLDHFAADDQQGTGEDDTTHFPEILRLHDRALDRPEEAPSEFAERIRKNLELRSAHQHVFVRPNLRELVERGGFRVRWLETRLPLNIICEAVAPASVEPP